MVSFGSGSVLGSTVEMAEISDHPGHWALVEERVISSASQTEDFTSLTGDTAGGYVLEGRIVNDQGSTSLVHLRLNEAAWAVNRQQIKASASTVTSVRDTTTWFTSVGASGNVSGFRVILPATKTGDVRHAIAHVSANTTTSIEIYDSYYTYTTPANTAEITAIGVGSDIASGIGVGSVLRLWKKVD